MEPNFEKILDKHLYNKFDEVDRQTFINAMKEVHNNAIQMACDNVECKADDDYLIPEVDKRSILKLKIE